MYKAAQAQGGQPGGAPGGGQPGGPQGGDGQKKEDEPIEAEYREEKGQ